MLKKKPKRIRNKPHIARGEHTLCGIQCIDLPVPRCQREDQPIARHTCDTCVFILSKARIVQFAEPVTFPAASSGWGKVEAVLISEGAGGPPIAIVELP